MEGVQALPETVFFFLYEVHKVSTLFPLVMQSQNLHKRLLLRVLAHEAKLE